MYDEVQITESVFYDPNHDRVFIRIMDGDYSLSHKASSSNTLEDVGAVFEVWEAGWGEPIGLIEKYEGKWFVVGDANKFAYQTVEDAVRSQVGP